MGCLPLLVSQVYDSKHPFIPPSAPLAEARRVVVEYGVRIVPLVYEESNVFHSILYRSTLLEASSLTTLSLESKNFSTEPKVVAKPSDRVLDVINAMLDADEWYSVVLEEKQYMGVMGFEHVIAYALNNDRLAEKLSSLKVGDAMTSSPLAIHSNDPVYKAWQTMLSNRFAALPVVGDDGRLVGVVAEYDLIKAGYARPRLEARKHVAKGPRVASVMSTPAIALYPEDPLIEAAKLIVGRSIGRVYVVDNDRRLIGVVDREDIIKAILDYLG